MSPHSFIFTPTLTYDLCSTQTHQNYYQLLLILCTHKADVIRGIFYTVSKLRWETDRRRLFEKECITVRVTERGRQNKGEVKCLHFLFFALCLHPSCTTLKDQFALFHKNLTDKQDASLEVTDTEKGASWTDGYYNSFQEEGC